MDGSAGVGVFTRVCVPSGFRGAAGAAWLLWCGCRLKGG
jgi:hypothetical protein